jgi:hypothetical protein
MLTILMYQLCKVKIRKKNIKKLACFKTYSYLCIVNQDKLVDLPSDKFHSIR